MKYTFIRVFTLAKKKAKEYTRVTVKKYNPYHGADGKFTTASGAGGSAASGETESKKTKNKANKNATYGQVRDKISEVELQDGTRIKATRNSYSHIYNRHRDILKNRMFEKILEGLPNAKDMRITLDRKLKEAKCYVIERKGKKYGVFAEREVKDGTRELITIYRLNKSFDKTQEKRWGQYHEQRNKININS